MPKKSATDRLKVRGEFITCKMRNARDSDKVYLRDSGGIFLPEDKITAKEAATLAKQLPAFCESSLRFDKRSNTY